MTPFEDFYLRVRDLMDTDVGRHLGQWFRDHPIYPPLEELYNATYSVSARYGKQGPDTSWNKPFGRANSTYSGSTYSNHSPQSRPTTPLSPNGGNGGLHHNWPNSPPSRPGSWSSLNKIKELEAENNSLKAEIYRLTEKLDNYKEEIKKANEGWASANKQNLELQKQNTEQRANAERACLRSAETAVRFKQYASAIPEYEQLSLLKRDQKRFSADIKDEEGRRKAEDAELVYMFEHAKCLAKDDQHSRADLILQSVLSMKQLLGSRRAESIDAHDVQTLLCEVLCRQGKVTEAKKLYRDAAGPLELGTLDKRSKTTCTWVLQNAMSYAHILVKERQYNSAAYWLEQILPNKHRTTAKGLQNLETEVLEIVTIMESRRESKQLIKLLERICQDKPVPLSEPMLYCYAKLGKLLHDRGQPDAENPKDNTQHDHAKASYYCSQAWIERQRLDISVLRATGWALALSLIYLKKYDTARDVLTDLQHATISENTAERPSHDEILGLLAHVQFMHGEFAAAESNAATLFDRYSFVTIFKSSSASKGIDFSKFHHADILIRARSKQKTKEKFREARSVWESIFNARNQIRGNDGSGKTQLVRHIASAKVLADEWEAFAKKIPATPKAAMAIREQVKKAEALIK